MAPEEVAVQITSRRDSEFYAALPRAERISLPQSLEHISQVQVCRTCTRSSNRLWGTSRVDQILHTQAGGDLEELMCAPHKPWGDFKVLNQTDFRGRIVDSNTVSDVPTRAIVETCGQNLRRDCTTCDRFNAVTVPVAYTNSYEGQIRFKTEERNGTRVTVPYTTDGSPVKYWNVTVGGSCSIPATGIVVNGETKVCDWQPRGKRIESPSCANCFYLDRKDDSWQFHHLEVNENAKLTPWERELVEPDQIGLALYHKQISPFGRRYWFEAVLLASQVVDDTLIYKVRFKQNNQTAYIPADDERFFVHVLDNDTVAVDILWPYSLKFNLSMPLYKRNRIWPALPTKTRIDHNCSTFIQPTCRECRPEKACYYHAKGPVRDSIGEIEFSNPKGRYSEWVYPPHGIMKVVQVSGSVMAVDGNGNKPKPYSDEVANASVFAMWLPTLMEKASYRFGEAGRQAIFKQYIDVVGGLMWSSRQVTYRPSWMKNSSIEPNKSYCSHPEGPNLRKVFQDSFGSERVDWDFDHGSFTHDQVEEEWRVGYRQHSQTPQRLQEEILATDASHPRYDPSSGTVLSEPVEMDDDVEVSIIESIGGMYHDDGTPVTSTREFYERLDDTVVIGTSGEAERVMTKRQQLFGYEMSRGYYGSRKGSEKTAMPAADPIFVIFDIDETDPDQIDIEDNWMCPECGHTYDHSEIENFFDPVCECGASLYVNHSLRQVYNPRQGGGIGNAYAMDTPRTQDQRRLYSTLCPHWRLNSGTTIITLDDVHGPPSAKPAAAEKTNRDEPVTILKVGGSLTPDQRKANEAYKARLDEVIKARDEYWDAHPETSPEELRELFPTPRGIVYQEKAAGSLSKMGGV